MNNKNIILTVLLFFFGCEFTQTDMAKNTVNELVSKQTVVTHPLVGKLEFVPVSADADTQAFADALKNVSKEDKERLYKITSGMALYVQQTEKVKTTLRVEQLLFEVEKDFGYNKLTDFNDVSKAFLIKQGWKAAKNIVKEISNDVELAKKQVTRDSVVADLNTIANGVKIARDSKE